MNLKKRRIFRECSCTTQQPDTATRECSENVLRMFREYSETLKCSENRPRIFQTLKFFQL